MIKEHKAAAYYPGWREKIEKLQKGDTVFLYKSGNVFRYVLANAREGMRAEKVSQGRSDK